MGCDLDLSKISSECAEPHIPKINEIFDSVLNSSKGIRTKGFSFYLYMGIGMEYFGKTYKGFKVIHNLKIPPDKIYFGKFDLQNP